MKSFQYFLFFAIVLIVVYTNYNRNENETVIDKDGIKCLGEITDISVNPLS